MKTAIRIVLLVETTARLLAAPTDSAAAKSILLRSAEVYEISLSSLPPERIGTRNATPIEKPALISSDHLAVLRGGSSEKLRETLTQGLSVNARDEQGNTPLLLTAVTPRLTASGFSWSEGPMSRPPMQQERPS